MIISNYEGVQQEIDSIVNLNAYTEWVKEQLYKTPIKEEKHLNTGDEE